MEPQTAGKRNREISHAEHRAARDRARARRRGKGNPRRRREHRHDQEALRLDRRRVDRGEPARLPQPPLHDAGRRGVHQRRHPLRRDDPPEGRRRDAVPGAARVEGRHPRHQGRPGSEAARPRRGRDGDRGARRSARSGSRSTAGSAPASRSGARRTRSRDTLPSEYCIWTNAHALARYAALCQEAGIVPIVEPEVLQDGTHSIERSGFVTSPRARRGLHRALRPARRRRGDAAQAEHGALRLRGVGARRRRGGRRRRRCTRCRSTCRRRCRASSSSPAASRTRTRPRT